MVAFVCALDFWGEMGLPELESQVKMRWVQWWTFSFLETPDYDLLLLWALRASFLDFAEIG